MTRSRSLGSTKGAGSDGGSYGLSVGGAIPFVAGVEKGSVPSESASCTFAPKWAFEALLVLPV